MAIAPQFLTYYAGNKCLVGDGGTWAVRMESDETTAQLIARIDGKSITVAMNSTGATLSGAVTQTLVFPQSITPIPQYPMKGLPPTVKQPGSYDVSLRVAPPGTGTSLSTEEARRAEILLASIVFLCASAGIGIPATVRAACNPLSTSQAASFPAIDTTGSTPIPTDVSPECKKIRQRLLEARIGYSAAWWLFVVYGCFLLARQSEPECVSQIYFVTQLRDLIATLYAESIGICARAYIDPGGFGGDR